MWTKNVEKTLVSVKFKSFSKLLHIFFQAFHNCFGTTLQMNFFYGVNDIILYRYVMYLCMSVRLNGIHLSNRCEPALNLYTKRVDSLLTYIFVLSLSFQTLSLFFLQTFFNCQSVWHFQACNNVNVQRKCCDIKHSTKIVLCGILSGNFSRNSSTQPPPPPGTSEQKLKW